MDQNQNNVPETRLNEALSALMDGEANELEVRRVLRELPASPEAVASWKRYHAIRASLQQELHAEPRVDLLAGIHARLAAEQEAAGSMHHGALSGMLRSRILRYVGQGAIAASVAFAALMGVSLLEVADDSDDSDYSIGGAAMVADAGTAPVDSNFNADVQTRNVAISAEAYSRLEQAVLREFSTTPAQIPVSYNPELPAELTPAE